MEEKLATAGAPKKIDNKTFSRSPMTMMHIGHSGKILSNLSIACAVIGMSVVLTFVLQFLTTVIVAMLGVLMFFAMILSVGTIFVVFPDWWSKTISVLESLGPDKNNIVSTVYNTFGQIGGYVALVGVAAAVISIILLNMDKTKPHKTRYITNGVMIGLCVIAFIVWVVGIIGG